jgi:hypothetical protein
MAAARRETCAPAVNDIQVIGSNLAIVSGITETLAFSNQKFADETW